MHTIRLKINDQVYDKLVWLLSKFSKDEVEIIPEDVEFAENQLYLQTELKEMEEGKAHFVPFDEVDQKLEEIIRKHESSI